MTVTAYPLNYGGSVEFTARQGRQALSTLMMPGAGPLRTRSGFRPGGAPVVSVTSTTWSVGPFSAIIDTGQSSVTGPYLVASDATEQGSVTAAHGTYDRKDILYVQLDDTDESDGSGQRRARPLYLAGTASATPTTPTTPARSLLVGTIDVPRSGGGSPAFTSSGLYTVAAGGVLPDDSTTAPPLGQRYAGQLYYRTDLDQLQVYTSTSATRVVWDGNAQTPSMGKASATTNQTGIGTAETVSLTVSNMLFKSGRAYRASIRGMVFGTAGIQAHFRLRKTNASGADWGEFGRIRCEGTNASDAAMVNGAVILLRSAGTDLTANVALTAVCSTAGGTVSVFGSATSPRYLLIEDIGAAVSYAGLGVDVT